MFNKIDMSNVFYNQGVCNIKDAQRNFEILCANEWKESLSSYPNLRTYCKFKTMFSAEWCMVCVYVCMVCNSGVTAQINPPWLDYTRV